MLTAIEAKQLYDESGVEIDNYLKFNIEPKVVLAAKSGHREVTVHIDSMDLFCHLDQVIKPLEKAVVEKLQGLKYIVKISLYGEKYVPRGLINEHGNGPVHQNYGFLISW